MTNQRLLITTAVAVIVAGIFVFGGGRLSRSSAAQKSGYSNDLNELRAKFDADKGKVRLLMLLSPT